MPEKSEISVFAELLKDEKRLSEIGSKVVMAAIERAYESRLGIPPELVQVERIWQRGNPIPEDLKGHIDPGSVMWREGWNDFWIWKDKWGDDKGMPVGSLSSAVGQLSRLRDMVSINEFSDEEIAVLKELQLIR